MHLAILQTHPIQYHAPLYRQIQNQGVDVTAVYGSDFSVTGYEDEEFGVSFSWDTDLLSGYSVRFLDRVEHGGPKRADQVSADGVREVLTDLDPDAILLTGYSPSFYWRSALAAIQQGKPLLFRAETTDHAVDRSLMKRLARDWLLRRLYHRCERLLYIGEHSRRHFRRLGVPDEKLVFSPYCVDTTPFRTGEDARTELRAETRSELDLSADTFTFLFCGKISHRKGPDLLADAVARLPVDQRASVAVVFLGDGEERASLEARAGDDLTFRFPGFQNQKRLSRYYHAADTLVLPSRSSETWGLVVNEGLHHGLPCIVSDAVGSAPDLVVPSKTGETFEAGSVPQLQRALQAVLDWHDGSSRVRRECREHVQKYTLQRAARGVVDALRDAEGTLA